MKKAIALLLSASMILACVGCTSEETTKKKSGKGDKTKKTTTEETDDPTEDPSEDPDKPTALPIGDTSDPDDDPTADPNDPSATKDPNDPSATADPTQDPNDPGATSDPTSAPNAPDATTKPAGPRQPTVDHLEITHDLEGYVVSIDTEYLTYGTMDPTDEDSQFTDKVILQADTFDVMSDEGIPDVLDKIFQLLDMEGYLETQKKAYAEEAQDFAQHEYNGEPLESCKSYSTQEFFRMDSQVISFKSHRGSFEGTKGQYEGDYAFNYRVEDGKEILFDDIVLDREGLAKYVESAFAGAPHIDFHILDIEDGTAVFYVLYDGIYIDGLGKIPFVGNETILDGEYFGATPDKYVLYLNHDNTLQWDFNDDGQLDSIAVSQTGPEELTVNVNGNDISYVLTEMSPCDDEFEIWDRQDQYVMFTEGKAFLVFTISEGMYNVDHIYIFEISDQFVTYANSRYGILERIYHPDLIKMYHNNNLLGDVYFAGDFWLASTGDLMNSSQYEKIYCGPLVTKVKLFGRELDPETFEFIGEYEIPSQTRVTPLRYSPDAETITFKILLPNEEDCRIIEFELESGRIICGYKIADAFEGLVFAN